MKKYAPPRTVAKSGRPRIRVRAGWPGMVKFAVADVRAIPRREPPAPADQRIDIVVQRLELGIAGHPACLTNSNWRAMLAAQGR